mgnify:FL=1
MIHPGDILKKPATFVLRCGLCKLWIRGLLPGGYRIPDSIPCPHCFAPVKILEMITLLDCEEDLVGRYSIEDLIGSNYADTA